MLDNKVKMHFMQISLIYSKINHSLFEIVAFSNKFCCNMLSLRQFNQNGKSLAILQISGAWNNISKLESSLKNLASLDEQDSISYSVTVEEPSLKKTKCISYYVNIVAAFEEGVLAALLEFIEINNIELLSLNLDNHLQSSQQVAVLVINAKINIEANSVLSEIREQFIILCDNLNVDGILDPLRPY